MRSFEKGKARLCARERPGSIKADGEHQTVRPSLHPVTPPALLNGSGLSRVKAFVQTHVSVLLSSLEQKETRRFIAASVARVEDESLG